MHIYTHTPIYTNTNTQNIHTRINIHKCIYIYIILYRARCKGVHPGSRDKKIMSSRIVWLHKTLKKKDSAV